MKNSLPPLSALVAFEAAGRLQSFTRAAAELNVTQAAVSRQIRLLEEHLGRHLFVRAHRAVELTNEGRDYLHTIVNALTHVGTATRELKETRRAPRLTISADQSIAFLWLMPRLKSFQEHAASVSFRLIVSDDETKSFHQDADISLIHGAGDWPSHDAVLLFAEEVVPVCSPAYLERHGRPRTPQDLIGHTLIDLEDEHWNWLNWRQWLTSQGVSLPAGPRGLVIDSYPVIIEAAINGMGFALGWRGLVDHELAAGRLITPLDLPIRTKLGYFAAWPRSRQLSLEGRDFVDWLTKEA
jgi:DNA-binding transcriptional LysR family regulator